MLFGFAATVVSMTQHVWCTAIPARSGSAMDVATHLAGVQSLTFHPVTTEHIITITT